MPGLVRIEPSVSPTDRWNDRAARTDFSVELRSQSSGIFDLRRLPQHLLKMHAGAPVRGVCGLGRRFVYQRGDLDLFPAGSQGTWECNSAGNSVFLWLSPSLLTRAAEEARVSHERTQLQPRYQFRDSRIEYLAWALAEDCRAGFPNGQLFSDSLRLAFAIALLGGTAMDGHAAAPIPQHGLSRRLCERVHEYIEAHLAEDLSLGHLASVVSLSSSHFRTLFKRATGQTVHAYLIQRRVSRAKELLLEGRLTANEVALEVGFSHQSHMARSMRRILGLTARDLKRNV